MACILGIKGRPGGAAGGCERFLTPLTALFYESNRTQSPANQAQTAIIFIVTGMLAMRVRTGALIFARQ